MAMQPKWDKYEIALLIDACEKVLRNEKEKPEIVSSLSSTLRNRAEKNGLTIDEIFRNKNGISLQMTKMDYILTSGEKGLPGASKYFAEIAEIWKTDRIEFNRILTVAKQQIDEGESIMDGNKDIFYQWLQKQEKTEQSASTIINAMDNASAYCLRHNLSNISWWEIDDYREFIDLAVKVLHTHLFRVTHRREAMFLDKVYIEYGTFLAEKEVLDSDDESEQETEGDEVISVEDTDVFPAEVSQSEEESISSESVSLVQTQDSVTPIVPPTDKKVSVDSSHFCFPAKEDRRGTKEYRELMGKIKNSPDEKLINIVDLHEESFLKLKLDPQYISVRSYNVLRRNNCATLGEILDYTPNEIRNFKNIGIKSLNEVLDHVVNTVVFLNESSSTIFLKDGEFHSRDKVFDVELLMDLVNGQALPENSSEEMREWYSRLREAEEIIGKGMLLFALQQPDAVRALQLSLFEFCSKHENKTVVKSKIERLLSVLPNSIINLHMIDAVSAFLSRKYNQGKYAFLKEIDGRTTVQYLPCCEQVYSYSQKQWSLFEEFISFLNTDTSMMNDVISSVINLLGERQVEILLERASGKTLEETGAKFSITRERIRQIESKAIRQLILLMTKQDIVDIFATIMTLDIQQPIVELNMFAPYFSSDNYSIITYLARNNYLDCDSYFYSSDLGAFILKSFQQGEQDFSGVVSSVLLSINGLITEDEYSNLVETALSESGVSRELLTAHLEKSISRYRGAVCVTKPTKSQIVDFILSQFFPDGYKIDDDVFYSRFLEILTSLGFEKLSSKFTKRGTDSLVGKTGVLYDRGVWISRKLVKIPSDFYSKLTEYIDSSPQSTLAYSEIFQGLKEYLTNNGIWNRYYLHGVLSLINVPYSLSRDYLVKEGLTAAINKDPDDSEPDAEKDELLREKHPALYQKLYSVSKIYDEPQGLSIDRIMNLISNVASKNVVVEFLGEVSWATKIGPDTYSFASDAVPCDEPDNPESLTPPVISVPIVSVAPLPDFNKDNFVMVLAKRFQSGITCDSIDYDKFRSAYDDFFDEEIDLTDEELGRVLPCCGLTYKGKIFAAEAVIDSATKEKLREYVEGVFASGKKMIYYKAIYSDMENYFICCFNLTDEEMLREYMKYSFGDEFFFFDEYLSKEDKVEEDPVKEIEQYLLSAGKPTWDEDIFVALSHIPKERIESELRRNKCFLVSANHEYFHHDIFQITADEAEAIASIIMPIIDDCGYATWGEVYNLIKSQMPEFIENNPYLTSLALRKCVAAELTNSFTFNSDVISEKGVSLRRVDIFCRFASHHDTFSVQEAVTLAKNLDNGSVPFDGMARVAVRVDKDLIMNRKLLSIDTKAVDSAIESYMSGDYILLQEIDSFLSFPTVGYEWNEFLLASYLLYFSRKYSLLNNGHSGDKMTGVVVRTTGKVQSFAQACAMALADNGVELKKDPAMTFLQNKGFIQRKSFAGIDETLKIAQKIINGRE